MSNAERLIEALSAKGPDPSAPVDEGQIERLVDAVGSLAEEDFVTKMISVEGVAMSARGIDGMREMLADWSGVFEEMRFEVEGIEERGENAMMLARQVSITGVGGVTMEQPSAVVFKFRDGRICRTEWHLDRAAAERSAAET